MKSDREFIDGIYEKAQELQEAERKPKHTKRNRTVAVTAVAALLVVFVCGNVVGKPIPEHEILLEDDEPMGRARTLQLEYYVEGKVVETLGSKDGYQRMRIQVNKENSVLPQEADMLMVAYLNREEVYYSGEYLKAEVIEQTLGDSQWFVITSERNDERK